MLDFNDYEALIQILMMNETADLHTTLSYCPDEEKFYVVFSGRIMKPTYLLPKHVTEHDSYLYDYKGQPIAKIVFDYSLSDCTM